MPLPGWLSSVTEPFMAATAKPKAKTGGRPLQADAIRGGHKNQGITKSAIGYGISRFQVAFCRHSEDRAGFVPAALLLHALVKCPSKGGTGKATKGIASLSGPPPVVLNVSSICRIEKVLHQRAFGQTARYRKQPNRHYRHPKRLTHLGLPSSDVSHRNSPGYAAGDIWLLSAKTMTILSAPTVAAMGHGDCWAPVTCFGLETYGNRQLFAESNF